MAREKPLYRDNLDRLDQRFPEKEALNYDELAALFAYSKRTAIRQWQKYYNRVCHGVPKTTVARAMCAE